MWRIVFAVTFFYAGEVYSETPCETIRQHLAAGDFDAAFAAADGLFGTSDPDCSNLVGEVYLKRGRNDEALHYFEKALVQAADNPRLQALSLNNLGLCNWAMGQNNLAKDYLQRAVDINSNLFGEDTENTAASLNDLGLVLSNTDADAALEYYEKSLTIYQNTKDPPLEKIVQLKLNIGIIYRQLEFFGDAVNHFNDALKIWPELHPEGHPNEGFIYINLGRTSLAMENKAEARAWYDKALTIYLRHYGEKHPEVAYIYNLIGNLHHGDEKFDEALSFYQKAFIANSREFSNQDPTTNPAPEQVYNANTLLSSLYAKAQVYMDKSIYKTLKFSDLNASLEILYICDKLIDYIRVHTKSESDKIALGNAAANVYETGALLCYIMANEALKKEPYYQQSYYFAEKSKSAVLLEAIAEVSAKSFANIPDDELEKEDLLNSEIAFYEQELAHKPDKNEETRLRERLFTLKEEYRNFVANLEKNYPKYFDLKYNVKVPSVEEIQKVLDDETMVVSYFLTEATSRIFIYQITKDKFSVANIAQPEDLNHYISGLRNSIRYQVYDLFELTASSLFKTLFPGSIPKSISKLVIIPSDRLGTVPFGALLTGKSRSKTEDYTALPYLARDYAITYQYASALFYQNKNITRTNDAPGKVFLCAPVHFNGIPDLLATKKEVADLIEIFNRQSLVSDKFTEAQAKKSVIKSSEMRDYKYIHFATHGYVDENNPQLSRLLLFESEEETDGKLFSGEIYNLNLSARLVTLSACETGLGKISKGEGIIGLSRAFTYAGAENILVSLWVVSDESTAQLMINFYDQIENDNYSLALKGSQLKLMGHPEYSKPFYWAPFILIGQ